MSPRGLRERGSYYSSDAESDFPRLALDLTYRTTIKSLSYQNFNSSSRTNNKVKDITKHLQKELARVEDMLNSIKIFRELGENPEEFLILGGEAIKADTDSHGLLFKCANILYALDEQGESTTHYLALFKQDPKYIALVLEYLSDSNSDFVESLLEVMRKFQYGLWDKQASNNGQSNLLYKFGNDSKALIIKILFKAGITASYFEEALLHAKHEENYEAIELLLSMLKLSDNNEFWSRALWLETVKLLHSAVAEQKSPMADLLLKYMPDAAITSRNDANKTILYFAKSKEMIQRLLGCCPELAEDEQLDQNLDSLSHGTWIMNYYNKELELYSGDYDLHLKKGYILEIIGRTEKALECYLKGKEVFFENQRKEQKSAKESIEQCLNYSNDLVQRLLEAQIQNKNIIIKTINLPELANQVKDELETQSDKSQAIALCISRKCWVSIFIASDQEKITIVCPNPKFFSFLAGVISGIHEVSMNLGWDFASIYSEKDRGEDGMYAVDNLVKIANLEGNLTKGAVNKKLAKITDSTQLSIKHQLILDNNSYYSDIKFNKLLEIKLKGEAYVAPVTTFESPKKLTSTIKLCIKKVLEEDAIVAVIPLHPHSQHWSSLVIKQHNKELFVMYSDSTGNPLIVQENAEAVIHCILEFSTKITIIDLQKTQRKTNDNGSYTIENIVSLIKADPLKTQDLKLAEEDAQNDHIQLLRDNGIPVADISQNNDNIIVPILEKR